MFGFGSVQQKSWEAMTWSWYSRAINVSRWSTHWSSARWRSREWFHIWAELQQLERSNSTPPSGWLLWQLPRNKSTTFVMRWNWGWLRAAGSRPAKNFGGGAEVALATIMTSSMRSQPWRVLFWYDQLTDSQPAPLDLSPVLCWEFPETWYIDWLIQ